MRIISKQFLPVEDKKHAHASSIVMVNGSPMIAWFEGTREGHPDVNIKIYHNENLVNYSCNLLSVRGFPAPHWNPVLFNFQNKNFMFFKMGTFCDRWNTFIADVSDFNNIRHQQLPAGINGCVKNKPLLIDDKIICGSSVETEFNWTSYIEIFSYDEQSQEFCLSNRSNPLFVDPLPATFTSLEKRVNQNVGVIQPTLCHDGEKYMAFMRSASISSENQKVFYSQSFDGIKWEKAQDTDLPNPNSSLDCVYYKDHIYLAMNPSNAERLPLSIVKLDKKLKFVEMFEVEKEVVSPCVSPQLSYPAMIEHEGKLHITFTNGRVSIQYNVIDLE